MSAAQQKQKQQLEQIPPLLIKAGLVFSESIPLSELFCKPKLLPIRGAALERLQELDDKIIEQRRVADEDKLAASKFGSDNQLGRNLGNNSSNNTNNNNNKSNENSSGSNAPMMMGGANAGNNDVPLIAETFVQKIEDFSQFR